MNFLAATIFIVLAATKEEKNLSYQKYVLGHFAVISQGNRESKRDEIIRLLKRDRFIPTAY